MRQVLARQVDLDLQATKQRGAALPGLELATGAAQHHVGQRHDQAALFGDGDERIRPDDAQRRMAPARQGLEAHQPVVAQVEQRLVGHGQVASFERHAQVAFELQTARGLGVQAGVEQGITRFASGLGLVHGDVGIAQHGFGRLVAHAAAGDADAGTGVELGACDVNRQLQGGQQALGQVDRHGIAFEVQCQHRELVAAEPGDDVVGPELVLQTARHLHQELVAGVVTQAVVDELEAIKVQKHHGKALLGMVDGRLHGGAQMLAKAAPVGQAGQGVVEGDVLQAGLGIAPRGDVVRLQNQAGRAGPQLGEQAAMRGHPQGVAVLVPAAQLERDVVGQAIVQVNHRVGERDQIFAADKLADVSVHQVFTGPAQQLTHRGVGLQDLAAERQQRHADRGVCESTVKTPFAGFQLAHMAGAGQGFAVVGFLRPQAHDLVLLLLAKHKVQGGHQHGDHRQDGHQHAKARLAVRDVEQGRDRGTGARGHAGPAEHAEQVGSPQSQPLLEPRYRRHQQRVDDEIGHRGCHADHDHQAVVGQVARLECAQQGLQDAATGEHRQ